MLRLYLASLLLASVDSQNPGECVEPAVCTPPHSKYSRVAPVQSRQQWTNKDGYCGSLSVQANAMAFGMWISQDQVRRAAGGYDYPGGGLEIYFANIVPALENLKLTHEDWDYENEPQPQYKNYFKWLKKQLVAGHPVVWMILTKERANSGVGAGAFSHIEPVWGIYSNSSLDDENVYDDDVVVHGADYWASETVEAPGLYRTFASLPDDERMQGNCGKAIPVIGKNEFYPCVMYDVAYGFAITGFKESGPASVPLSLAVDRFDEPEYPWDRYHPAADLHGTVTIHGPLEKGASYKILRWDDHKKVPTDGSYLKSDYDHEYDFIADDTETHVFKDPNSFKSSGTTYYRCVKVSSTSVV